jgi:hypothetical protein
MGDALGHHVAFLLNRERHFPGNHSANQFSCEHIETRGKVLYEIIDQELDIRENLPPEIEVIPCNSSVFGRFQVNSSEFKFCRII